MEFQEVDQQFAELRQRVADGKASGSELDEWRGRNFALDEWGCRWGKGSTVDEWYFDSGSGWTLGVPPGHPLVANGQVFGFASEGEEAEFCRVTDFFEFEGRIYVLLKSSEEGLDIKRVGKEGRALLIDAPEDDEFEKVVEYVRRRDHSPPTKTLREEPRLVFIADGEGVEHRFQMVDALVFEGGIYGWLIHLDRNGEEIGISGALFPARITEANGHQGFQFIDGDERNKITACFEARREHAEVPAREDGFWESPSGETGWVGSGGGERAVPEEHGEWTTDRVASGELLREAAMPLRALTGGEIISTLVNSARGGREIPPDSSPAAPAEMLAFLDSAQGDPGQLVSLIFHDGFQHHGVYFTKVAGNPPRVYFDDPYGNDSMLGAGNNQIGVASREELDGHSISAQEFEVSVAAIVVTRLWRERHGMTQGEIESAAETELHNRLYGEATRLVDGELIFDDAGSLGKPGWMARRKLKKAIPVLERVLQIRPSNWSAMFVRGKIHQRLEQSGESLRWFSAAHEANPGQPDVAREAAFAALNLGRANEAVSLCLSAVSANPDDAGLIANLALAHLLAGDPASAVERAREAISARPDDPVATNVLRLAKEVDSGARPCPRKLAEAGVNL